MNLESAIVHAGERDRVRDNRSVTIPLEQTATYFFENTDQIVDFYEGRLTGVKYGRYGCPTQHALEEKMALIEKMERALAFSSGMSAITTTILALTRKNDHIIFIGDCYRNTRNFFLNTLRKFGISATEIPVGADIKKYLKKNTKLFFSEVPTNPFLRVIDLKSTFKIIKEQKIINVVDSSFGSPVNIRPKEFGADLVVHSATKYLGGHHDLFAGIVAGKAELIEKIQKCRDILGGIIDPHTSFLLLRSLQTLGIRMQAHNEKGLRIAQYLENHPLVDRVWYPGLKSHPDYQIAKKQMSGFGGVVTFSLKASENKTSKFIDNLKIPYIATNFCGPQSLIEQHAILTFYNDRISAKQHGITGNLIRYSSGFEDTRDVIADFDQAFKKIK
jgi:cystathionine gamma-synthase